MGEISTHENLLVAYEDEPMWSALQKLGMRDVGRLPVVLREDSRKMLEMVRRKDIIQAYNLAIVKKSRHLHYARVADLNQMINGEFIHLRVP